MEILRNINYSVLIPSTIDSFFINFTKFKEGFSKNYYSEKNIEVNCNLSRSHINLVANFLVFYETNSLMI